MKVLVLDRLMRPVAVASYDEVERLAKKIMSGGMSDRGSLSLIIPSNAWTQETTPGHPFLNGYYADATHGKDQARIAVVQSLMGADNYIHVCDGTNERQEPLSSTVIRIWLMDEPSYDLLCLVVYA